MEAMRTNLNTLVAIDALFFDIFPNLLANLKELRDRHLARHVLSFLQLAVLRSDSYASMVSYPAA